jgi:hypothetical protein
MKNNCSVVFSACRALYVKPLCTISTDTERDKMYEVCSAS